MAFGAYLQGLGLVKGDRVAVMMPNVPQYPIAVAAILRAGLVLVNVNPLYTARELEHQLKDSGAKAIVILENFAATLEKCLPATGGQACGAVRDGRPARPAQGRPGQLRRAPQQEAGAAVPHARGRALQRGRRARHLGHLEPPGHQERRHGGAAVHRRHHRRVQGRRAAAPQPGGQRAAERGLGRAADAHHPDRRAAHHRVRLAAVPHLRLHLLHDAVDAAGRQADPDRQSARPARHVQGIVQAPHPPDAGGQHLVQRHGSTIPNSTPWTGAIWSAPPAAAAPCRASVAKLWLEKTGRPILEGYGLSETSPVASGNPANATEYSGSIGVPLPNTWMKLLDDDGNEVGPGRGRRDRDQGARR